MGQHDWNGSVGYIDIESHGHNNTVQFLSPLYYMSPIPDQNNTYLTIICLLVFETRLINQTEQRHGTPFPFPPIRLYWELCNLELDSANKKKTHILGFPRKKTTHEGTFLDFRKRKETHLPRP